MTRAGIPVTSPVLTLIDLATVLPERQLEHAINEGDRLDLVSPLALLAALEAQRPGRGWPRYGERSSATTSSYPRPSSSVYSSLSPAARGAPPA